MTALLSRTSAVVAPCAGSIDGSGSSSSSGSQCRSIRISAGPAATLRPTAVHHSLKASVTGLASGTAASSSSSSSSNSRGSPSRRNGSVAVRAGLGDFVGGDLVGLDLGQWVDEVETFGAVGFYAPPEGGAECRYATALKYQGYHFLNVSARGIGDIEAYLLKPHGVRPPHLGKQPVARFYYPGEVDYRLSVLPQRYKGLVVWVGEAKVLSKNELQFLSLLPALRPNVKVVCEMGGSRKFNWTPLKDLCGLTDVAAKAALAAPPVATPIAEKLVAEEKKEEVTVSK